jgi:hypothetical protein
VLVLAVFDAKVGTTYSCDADGARVSLVREDLVTDDYNPTECSLTLDEYGPSKGDHVRGTFTASLISHAASGGDLELTEGTFDLVMFSDTP